MLPGYLLSLLVRQRALLGNRFEQRYPHAWLVWEAGERQRPESPAEAEDGKTRLPSGTHSQRPVGDDALCFPLPEPSKQGNFLTLGRQAECSITIDDMSISREHAWLYMHRGSWHIEVTAGASVALMVRHMSLQPGEPVALVNGCSITAGGVTLTFYERNQFVARLVDEEKRTAG